MNDKPRARRTNSKKANVALAATFAAAAVFAVGAGCGVENATVGGECAAGFAECNLACVDLTNDPANCGTCGNVCPSGLSCTSGVCGTGVGTGDGGDGGDGGPLDGSSDGRVGDTSFDALCTTADVFECIPVGDGGDGGDSGEGGGSRDGGDGGDATVNPDGGDGGDGSANGDGSSNDGTVNGDGSTNDGSSNDGTVNGDGSTGDGSTNDGSTGDGSLNDGAPVDTGPIDACPPPPYDNPNNCGACGTVCPTLTPLCGLVAGSYTCLPICDPLSGLSLCNGKCVDETSDPNNCGSCNNVCASGYCLAGVCQGSIPGNIIVAGHDFGTTLPGSQEATVLTNAIFYNNTPQVRVLSWERWADPAVVANVKTVLNAFAASYNRRLIITPSVSLSDIPSGTLTRSNYDALLVYDQPLAPAGALGTLGSSWSGTLGTFTVAGGIVVSLDSATGIAEMPSFTTNGGLLAVTSHAPLACAPPSPNPIDVNPAASVMRSVTNVYACEPKSASFLTPEPASATTIYGAFAEVPAVPPALPTQGDLVVVQKIVQ